MGFDFSMFDKGRLRKVERVERKVEGKDAVMLGIKGFQFKKLRHVSKVVEEKVAEESGGGGFFASLMAQRRGMLTGEKGTPGMSTNLLERAAMMIAHDDSDDDSGNEGWSDDEDFD